MQLDQLAMEDSGNPELYAEVAQYMLAKAQDFVSRYNGELDTEKLAWDTASDFALMVWGKYDVWPKDWVTELARQVAAYRKEQGK